MSTVIARKFASTPVRTAMETWSAIVDLLAPDDGPERDELMSVAGVACSAISAEAVADAPIVVFGGGPRVRIRCVYGDGAVAAEDVNEEELPRSPLDGEWRLSIPCPSDDLAWMKKNLSAKSSHIRVRDLDEDVDDDADGSDAGAEAAPGFRVNLAEYLRE